MESITKKGWVLLSFFIAISFLFICTPAFSAQKPVGKLSDFSGDVLIRSQGSWGVEPEIGLPLYSDDKLVTKTGTATVTFNDGAVMELKKNSNLLIEEKEETEGLFKKMKVTKRRLRMLLGKLIFKSGTGRANAETSLVSPTMVCGLRGTEVIFSMGPDNQPYLYFTEGGAAYTIGDFITGEAPGVPDEVADMNPAQRAAFAANAAAQVLANIEAKEAAGVEVPEEAKQLAQALYDEAKAYEDYYGNHLIEENNPDAGVVEDAATAARAANAAAQAARTRAQSATEALEESGEQIPAELEGDVQNLLNAVEDARRAQDAAAAALPEGYSREAVEGAEEALVPPPGPEDIWGVDVEPGSPI